MADDSDAGRRKDAAEAEHEAVKSAIGAFSEGIRKLDADKIVRVFHREGTSYSLTPRGVCIEPAAKWYEIIDRARADPDHLFHEDFTMRILAVDVVGTVAAAKVEWSFKSARIVDFYNLLRVNERWCIVNQVYHTLRKPETH